MRNPYTIFTGTTGLNNIVDTVRLKFDPETGIAELSESVDCDIDDSGGVSRRAGRTLLQAGNFHSLFCNKGDCFVVEDRVSDAALYKVGTGLTLTGIRSGLTKGERVSFFQVGDKTYYSSLFQNGMCENGLSYAWPTHTHVGVDTHREFYPAPLGSHIAYLDGRMWIVVGDTIYVSEMYQVGSFRLAARGFPFPSDVRMIKPVAGGMWVSDSTKTGFIRSAEKFEQMVWDKESVYPVPAHEWSECIELVDLSKTIFNIPGQSAIWSCDDGLCIGTESGRVVVATKDKLNYLTGAMGATVAVGHNVINSVY